MENFSNFLFRHRASLVDPLEELAVLAELHEDIDLVVLADDLVDLGDVLMHQVLLQLDLTLDGLQLLGLVLLDRDDLDRHSLASEPMDRLLHLPKSALADGLPCVNKNVLSS
jgi:hypothetical protein